MPNFNIVTIFPLGMGIVDKQESSRENNSPVTHYIIDTHADDCCCCSCYTLKPEDVDPIKEQQLISSYPHFSQQIHRLMSERRERYEAQQREGNSRNNCCVIS